MGTEQQDQAAAAAALASLMARVRAATISESSPSPPSSTATGSGTTVSPFGTASRSSAFHHPSSATITALRLGQQQQQLQHHHQILPKTNDDDDHDDDHDDEASPTAAAPFEIPQRYTKSGRKRAVSFPLKLMKVLSDPNLSHIVSWTPSGRAFVILKPSAFTAEVLPEHFKSAKFSSFTRKLHRWGFQRHYRGEEAGAYYHDEFQRDRLDMVENMSCHKSSHMSVPSTSSPVPGSSKVIAAPSPNMDSSANKVSSFHTPPPRMSMFAASLKKQQQDQQQQGIAIPPGPARLPGNPLASPSIASATAAGVAGRGLPPMLPFQRSPALGLQTQSLVGGTSFSTGRPTSTLVAAEINAAIELEVSRRLQERIQQAASQMASSTTAGGQPPLPQSASFSSGGATVPPLSSLNDSSAALRAKLLQLRQQKEQMELLAMTGGFVSVPARGLPPAQAKNVQGAKTA